MTFRRAFTLIELLVVIAIMGIMGTAAIGGYRAMQRGMEERGTMQNVNQFIRSAYQRAQIDRLPVQIYFWNETLREDTENDTLLVVGRAVAVRRAGRISNISSGGTYLYDEFGDLSFSRLMLDEDEGEESNMSGNNSPGSGMYLYCMDGVGSSFRRSLVSQTTKLFTLTEPMLDGRTAQIDSYAYTVIDKGNCEWHIGSPYGFEFAEIQLPHNFIFGSTFSDSVTSPVREIDVMKFRVSGNSGAGSKDGLDGTSSIQISNLRPDDSGVLKAEVVGSTDSPTKSLY